MYYINVKYLYIIVFKGNEHIPHDLMGAVDSMVPLICEECLLNHQPPTSVAYLHTHMS